MRQLETQNNFMAENTLSMKTRSAIRVVVADDHPALRMGIVTVINAQSDMTVVGEAVNGVEAVEQCTAHGPDVVLMDLRMPGGGGFEAISKIVATLHKTQVVVLTTYDLDEDIYRALHAGAKAFLLKDATMMEITDTIRKVHRGERILHPQIATRLGNRLKREELTQRELEILQLIVKGKSNKEISAVLFIAEATVKSHLKTLFHKMGVNVRTEAAIEAVRSGLVHLERE
jgi:two-component system, NarL family, response regulator